MSITRYFRNISFGRINPHNMHSNRPNQGRLKQSMGTAMGMSWEKHLSVGNAAIDSDHKHLMNMVNAIELAIRARDCRTLSQLFDRLENWLCMHFSNEEKIAETIGFNPLQQKPAQQYSLKELQHLRNELTAKRGIWCESAIEHYSRSLCDWVNEHIIKTGLPMKPILQAMDYEFWPRSKKGETNPAARYSANLYLRPSGTSTPCTT